MSEERVVLVDEDGRSIGSVPKSSVHHEQTPLHLAFSCYVFDRSGRLLVTQRAHHKATFPGVWTNSFCGHPSPGEDMLEAVERRAEQELGLSLEELTVVLARFRYTAIGDNGVQENELCPVFTAVAASAAVADPAEVAALEWVRWPSFRDEVLAGEREVSTWCGLQVAELAAREVTDGSFLRAERADLPPAARTTQ